MLVVCVCVDFAKFVLMRTCIIICIGVSTSAGELIEHVYCIIYLLLYIIYYIICILILIKTLYITMYVCNNILEITNVYIILKYICYGHIKINESI